MKPRLNPPDVSAVVPPTPTFITMATEWLPPANWTLTRAAIMGTGDGGAEEGEKRRGSHWPMTFSLFLPLAAALQMAVLPLFHVYRFLCFTDSLPSSSLPHQCRRSSSPLISPLPQWGSSCTSPVWCHLGTCPYASPGTKMASSSCRAPPLASESRPKSSWAPSKSPRWHWSTTGITPASPAMPPPPSAGRGSWLLPVRDWLSGEMHGDDELGQIRCDS